MSIPVSVSCSTMEELWTSLFSENYSDYYRDQVAAEIRRRIRNIDKWENRS